jgi:hypothetical protein
MSARPFIIPVFEPEVVTAEAQKRWHGNYDKVTTTSVRGLRIGGVTITSQYRKAAEYQVLGDIVTKLPPELRELIANVWCDSKARWFTVISLKRWSEHHASLIGDQFERELLSKNGSHDGIWIESKDSGESLVCESARDAGRRDIG